MAAVSPESRTFDPAGLLRVCGGARALAADGFTAPGFPEPYGGRGAPIGLINPVITSD